MSSIEIRLSRNCKETAIRLLIFRIWLRRCLAYRRQTAWVQAVFALIILISIWCFPYIFGAMQRGSFYRFGIHYSFSGNAETFLLPFLHPPFYFGQCSDLPFTVLASTTLFRAMQRPSFYRFCIHYSFSGNAVTFLLPFWHQLLFFG
jgi:hypothetical protein